jgi:integrase
MVEHHVRDVGVAGFKSCHSDQILWSEPDFPQLSAIPSNTEAPRVHKGVHRRLLRMASLAQDSKGNYKARKRLPDDVRDEYGRLYGARYEAKFFAPKTSKAHEVKRLYGNWLAEVEGRIAAIRADRDGTGRTLTRVEARKLAGDWYEWFTARHAEATEEDIDWRRDTVREALTDTVGDEEFERLRGDVWDQEEVREAVRPVLAEVGETAQFLALTQIALTRDARNLFLDFLYDDLAAALKRLLRLADGDYSSDKYAERFPKVVEGTDSGITSWQLFENWVAERKPAYGTIESWRYIFHALAEHFADRSAASLMPEEAASWVKGLITPKRSAATVKRTWLNAPKTVFHWALEQKHIRRNPFAGIKVTVPKRKQLRDTRAFHADEASTILTASCAITNTRTVHEACKRWVPWLCAYTGARPGEMTQLRGVDVMERDGIHAIRITPEAGTVKGGAARVVPLHEHLIAQGFLKFIEGRGRGPLFYNPAEPVISVDPTKQKKPRPAQARQRLATWVRELGVSDPHISPNHAWRHTFKQRADRANITERMSDYITGHAHKSEGAGYGAPTLEDMAAALKKFPRYTLG